MRSRYHDVDDTVQGLPVQLTLYWEFPRTIPLGLPLSVNHGEASGWITAEPLQCSARWRRPSKHGSGLRVR